MLTPKSVSYTHLDVYKRQTQEFEARGLVVSTANTRAEPVSYTHLDVYKRQHSYSAPGCR